MKKITFFYSFLTLVLVWTFIPSGIQASDCANVEKSFKNFCRVWLDSSRKYNDDNLKWMPVDDAYEAQFTRCSTDYQYYIKKTDSSAAPYIGVLKYREYSCVASAPCLTQKSNQHVRIVTECPVTEIFMFKNGQWHY